MSLACSSIAINDARERTIANVNNEVESKAANTLDTLRVIRGTLGNLQTKNIVVSTLLRQRDRERVAATGALLAAMGFSGPAAAMAMNEVEDMDDPATLASFELNEFSVETLLWNWPFKEGDQLAAAGRDAGDGHFIALAVLHELDRIIVLYPHLSAGHAAHWRKVARLSLLIGVPVTLLGGVAALLGFLALDESLSGLYKVFPWAALASISMFCWVGYRLGRRLVPFTRMAESVFKALEWADVKNIDLRALEKGAKRSEDPPALGDSYFRY